MYKVRVVKLMDYGAFVELPNGFQALLHISELEHERVRTPAPASLCHHLTQSDSMTTSNILYSGLHFTVLLRWCLATSGCWSAPLFGLQSA